jgi:hypothetical protein
MGIDDPQDEAEALDDEELVGAVEFPPERPFAVEDYGTTPAEERVPEPLEEFVRREQPEKTRPRRPESPVLIDPTTIEGLEGEPDVVGVALEPFGEVLAEGDEFSGDETERDVATELESPLSAEEAAIHVFHDGTKRR